MQPRDEDRGIPGDDVPYVPAGEIEGHVDLADVDVAQPEREDVKSFIQLCDNADFLDVL